MNPLPDPHPDAQQLEEISVVLDLRPEVYDIMHTDLVACLDNPNPGREGMIAEQVLHGLIVTQNTGYGYEAPTSNLLPLLGRRAARSAASKNSM